MPPCRLNDESETSLRRDVTEAIAELRRATSEWQVLTQITVVDTTPDGPVALRKAVRRRDDALVNLRVALTRFEAFLSSTGGPRR